MVQVNLFEEGVDALLEAADGLHSHVATRVVDSAFDDKALATGTGVSGGVRCWA